MGILHLIFHLRPYAEIVSSLRDQDVVIDGPAMAYHIYHICLSLRPEAKNPFEAAPTYRELGEAVILWLEFLQTHQLRIKKIFFDGYLPSSKKEVRISRLQGLTKQLNTYSTAYQPSIPSSQGLLIQDLTSQSLLSPGKISIAASQIPVATFQVAAIIEALCESEKYGSIVQVVPDEADIFCADYVQKYGGIILTGDSDLLVHDLGPSGSVVFFRDLEITEHVGQYNLACLQFRPSAIAKRLNIMSVKNLGFAILMDSYASFPQLLQRSQDVAYISKHEEMYKSFKKEYESSTTMQKTDPLVTHSNKTSQLLQKLHPRLSEFILQFSYFSSIAWSSFNLAPHSIEPNTTPTKIREIFLPFILDSPLRTSAWDLSTAIRLTAYSLLNIVVLETQQIEIVIERRRQENGSKGRQWMLPDSDQLAEALQSMLSIFQKLQKGLDSMTNDGNRMDLWRAYAIYIDMEDAKGKGKTALSESEYGRYQSTQVGKYKVRWETVHHIAQLQSTYYSLRILKQILDLVLSIQNPNPEQQNTNTNTKTTFKNLQTLHTHLSSLPPLSTLPSFNKERKKLNSTETQSMLRVVRDILETTLEDESKIDESNINESKIEEEVVRQEKKKRKRKKNKKTEGSEKRGRADEGGGNLGTLSGNLFSVLGIE